MPSRCLSAVLTLLVTTASAVAGAESAPPAAGGAYRGLLLEMSGDENAPVRVWNAEGKPVLDPYYAFEKKGLALVGREYSLQLEGGCFFSGGTEDYLGGGLKNAGGELTLAAYVCPAAAAPEQPGLIAGYGPPRGGALLLALTQEKDALFLSIGAAEPRRVRLADLKSAAPFHLVLTVTPKEIVLHRDGEKAGSFPGTDGDFAAWEKGVLWLGNSRKGDLPWRGRLERLALHNRAMGTEEARKTAVALLEEIRKREPVPSIELEGTLLARSKYHKPWDEGFTYREVLSVCEYKVDKVIRGEYKEAKIRVAEWMFVDTIFLTNSRKQIGATCRLTVEPKSANPQLRTTETGNTLDPDDDAVIHLDLSPLVALPEKQQPRSDKDLQ